MFLLCRCTCCRFCINGLLKRDIRDIHAMTNCCSFDIVTPSTCDSSLELQCVVWNSGVEVKQSTAVHSDGLLFYSVLCSIQHCQSHHKSFLTLSNIKATSLNMFGLQICSSPLPHKAFQILGGENSQAFSNRYFSQEAGKCLETKH